MHKEKDVYEELSALLDVDNSCLKCVIRAILDLDKRLRREEGWMSYPEPESFDIK